MIRLHRGATLPQRSPEGVQDGGQRPAAEFRFRTFDETGAVRLQKKAADNRV